LDSALPIGGFRQSWTDVTVNLNCRLRDLLREVVRLRDLHLSSANLGVLRVSAVRR